MRGLDPRIHLSSKNDGLPDYEWEYALRADVPAMTD
jgi:hypothetical protein